MKDTGTDTHNSRSLYSASKQIMAAILLVAVTAMASSILTLVQSRTDAAAINVSGSLRMQNYRLAYAIERGEAPQEIVRKALQLERSLHDPSLESFAASGAPPQLREKYLAILQEWEQLKPHLMEPSMHQQYQREVPAFVKRIDRLVYLIQLHLEDKVVSLALFQGFCLMCLATAAVISIQIVRRRVVQPLDALVSAAQSVQERRFDVRLPVSHNDELGVLSATFNDMASELDQRYRGLERTVEKTTDELKQANASLSLLYQCSEAVHVHLVDEGMLTELLERLQAHLQLSYLAIQLSPDRDLSLPRDIAVGSKIQQGFRYRRALAIAPVTFGDLHIQAQKELNADEHQLLEGFCRLLARVFHVKDLLHREQTLLLLEERSIIARELHDSLAQSLSYLKIQVTRLNHSLRECPPQPGAQTIIDEIDQGIRGAYQQLRELLSTFRLSVKANSLEDALEKMLAELQPQTQVQLDLNYQLHRPVLEPHQLIHVLQISREATLNAIRHARASRVQIGCHHHDTEIRIDITDNGCGMLEPDKLEDHFGLGIMQERAVSLHGKLTITSPSDGGTLVRLEFPAA